MIRRLRSGLPRESRICPFKRKAMLASIAIAAAFSLTPIHVYCAALRLSVIGGNGDQVDVGGAQISVASTFGRDAGEAWHWNLYWNGQLSRWHGREAAAMNSVIWDAGLAPSIRLESVSLEGSSPYLSWELAGMSCPRQESITIVRLAARSSLANLSGAAYASGVKEPMWWGCGFSTSPTEA
jgi:hypothetical protein